MPGEIARNTVTVALGTVIVCVDVVVDMDVDMLTLIFVIVAVDVETEIEVMVLVARRAGSGIVDAVVGRVGIEDVGDGGDMTWPFGERVVDGDVDVDVDGGVLSMRGWEREIIISDELVVGGVSCDVDGAGGVDEEGAGAFDSEDWDIDVVVVVVVDDEGVSWATFVLLSGIVSTVVGKRMDSGLVDAEEEAVTSTVVVELVEALTVVRSWLAKVASGTVDVGITILLVIELAVELAVI